MKLFNTFRNEDLKSKFKRLIFNIFPAYRRGGGRVCFISSDWREVHVKLTLNWQTRNYVGSVFGGSIYAAIDPIYMLQLLTILGDNYVVWDKAAAIKFIRPIKNTVIAKFEVNDVLLEEITNQVAQNGKYTIDLPVSLTDKGGVEYASVIKTLYIASKEYYKSRPQKPT